MQHVFDMLEIRADITNPFTRVVMCQDTLQEAENWEQFVLKQKKQQ